MDKLTREDRQTIVYSLLNQGEWGVASRFASPEEFIFALSSSSGLEKTAAKKLQTLLQSPEQQKLQTELETALNKKLGPLTSPSIKKPHRKAAATLRKRNRLKK